MTIPKLSKLELKIMDLFWLLGQSSVREIQEALPASDETLAYSTVQTVIYRLENKKALERVKKIGNAHIFKALVTRDVVHGTLISDFLNLFGGNASPLMSHLVQSGKLSLKDIQEAEEIIRNSEQDQDNK